MPFLHPDRDRILSHVLGPENNYCTGFIGGSWRSQGHYLLAACLGAAKVPRRFFHDGSDVLDSIFAFDLAEVDLLYMGQINVIRVSSFCGPQGLIWGYDVASPGHLYERHPLGVGDVKTGVRDRLPVYSLWPLIQAARELFGTRQKPVFPIQPGSHVPCAEKKKILKGPGHIYCALGIGIARDRRRDACLLMEDVGEIPAPMDRNEQNDYRRMILTQVAHGIVEVGGNQNIEYGEVFVGLRDLFLEENEIGCALVAAPYFLLARGAEALAKGC
jgi:histidine decarboxylase